MNTKTALMVRLTVLAFALINQVLVENGYHVLPVSEAELEQALTALITLAAALWNLWAQQRKKKGN